MTRYVCLALICAATTLTAQTSSPWNGTWKPDQAKSHLTGRTYTISKGANGMWISTFGSLTVTYAPNGKPYPVFDKNHTMTATLVNPNTLKTVNQANGKTTAVSTDTLSPDGKTVSDVTVNTRADGSTYTTTETDTRTTPGQGFFGTWTSTKASSSSYAPEIITTSGNSITFSNPKNKVTLTAKLDGTPATPVSPDMPAGVTVSYKKVSPTRLDYIVMLKGKQIAQGYDELSAGGKSYTDVNWMVGKESEKTTEFFDKQ